LNAAERDSTSVLANAGTQRNVPGAFREGGFNDRYTITAWDSMAQSNTDGRVLLSPGPYLAVAETVNEPDFVQATPLQETGTHANSCPPEGPMDTEDPNGAVTYEKRNIGSSVNVVACFWLLSVLS